MDERVKVGYYIARETQARLRALAKRDHRSLSAQIAWLIEQEWQRTIARAGVRRPQGRDRL